MFKKLIASAPDHRRWLRNPVVILVSVAVHVLVLGGIVWASTRPEEAAAPEPERLTYIDITEIPPPEPDPDEIFEAPPEPTEPPPVQQATAPAPRTVTPPTPQRAPATPRNPQPSPAATEQPAGFQELQVPDVDVSGIPKPDVSAPAVRAEDFGGRGTPGGTASGTPAPPVPAAARTGTGEGSGSGARGVPGGDGSGTYSVNLVDEPAELINRDQVARALVRRYPKSLQDAGVEGRVVVQFVVDQNGRVEPGSVRVLSASQQEFAEPTKATMSEFRFRPAKRQGRTVRQIVQLPVTWQINR